MPTGRSWADVRHLLWFRLATVRRRRAVLLAPVVLVLVSVAVAILPAAAPGMLSRPVVERALPDVLVALVLVTVTAAVATAGGRELLARDAASIHPISPFTDHLGSLLLVPLSAPWLIQTWGLLAAVTTVTGPRGAGAVLVSDLVALTWIACAGALGQAVAWLAEWLRRGPHGVLAVRLALGLAVPIAAVVVAPAHAVARVIADPRPAGTGVALLASMLGFVVLVAIGGRAAALASRRLPRDEARLESRSYPPRPDPRSSLAAMRRLDRISVWRSVPLRRGMCFLTVTPGLLVLVHPLAWGSLVVLPGLVVSGCVLLFGVNLWGLDGRGLLWRASLPVDPRAVLVARMWVLSELLLGAGVVTLLLGSVRAGRPSPAMVLAVGVSVLVTSGQALSAGLRWSLRSPYAVDLRSARATPAPPLVMVGYSFRLAITTTVSTVLLSGLAYAARPGLVLLVGAVLLACSSARLVRAGRRWSDPERRSRIVAVVTA